MADLKKRALEAEEIEHEEKLPEVGQWFESEWSEDVWQDDEKGPTLCGEFSDCDGPVIKTEPDPECEHRILVTRRVLVCVTHVGSNYAEISTVGGDKHRIHLDNFYEECTPVADPDARIAAGVAYWQREMAEASKTVAALMGEIGLGGRQLAPATQALAVSLGSKATDEYKGQLARVKETLPELYERMNLAGKEMGRWMAARAIPLRAQCDGLKEYVASIDRRLLAVDLYAGLSEDAEMVRKGDPAAYAEQVHVFQGLHFMDEEAIAHYKAGGIIFDSIDAFDAWMSSSEHFERLFPFPRCVVAFRVRRHEHAYEGTTPFVRMFLQARDEATFLYVRNGEQLWRLSTAMKFGSHLYPDREHSKFAMGDELWCTPKGDVITLGELEEMRAREASRPPREWAPWDRTTSEDYAPFDSSNVYYDDVSRKIAHEIEEHNRAAVLLQGLFDRSAVLHPHPPVKMWDHKSFSQWVRLVYEADRAVTAGPAPDFAAYAARLRESITQGSWVIGQRDVWDKAEAERVRKGGRRQWQSDNPGPKYIDQVVSFKKGKATFQWRRKSQRREGVGYGYYKRYEDKYIDDSISVDVELLFNVSAYKPGDFRRFFEDPRTRAQYMKWAKYLLYAEEFHAGQVTGTPVLKPESEEPEDFEDEEPEVTDTETEDVDDEA